MALGAVCGSGCLWFSLCVCDSVCVCVVHTACCLCTISGGVCGCMWLWVMCQVVLVVVCGSVGVCVS